MTSEQTRAEPGLVLSTESPTKALSRSSAIKANVEASIKPRRGDVIILSGVPNVGANLRYEERIGPRGKHARASLGRSRMGGRVPVELIIVAEGDGA